MKQEYTDKMKSYQKPEYESFLKEKCVLDAWQFLHSSMLYLNYALITAKLYEDIGKKNITESNKNPMYNSVEVLGYPYDAHILLNKLTLEWTSHISNSLDCLLQYINSALCLRLQHKNVDIHKITAQLYNYASIENAVNSLWNDDIVNYIRSVYNFSKHTLNLYGGSSFMDTINGQKDIHIPKFKFKNIIYESKTTNELIAYYETFIGKYISIIDNIDIVLHNTQPISNRFHICQVIIDNTPSGTNENNFDIVLNAEFDADGQHIKRCWIENSQFNLNNDIEIMPPHSKNIGQHLGGIKTIEVIDAGNKIGELHTDLSKVDRSVLAYYKYQYYPI